MVDHENGDEALTAQDCAAAIALGGTVPIPADTPILFVEDCPIDVPEFHGLYVDSVAARQRIVAERFAVNYELGDWDWSAIAGDADPHTFTAEQRANLYIQLLAQTSTPLEEQFDSQEYDESYRFDFRTAAAPHPDGSGSSDAWNIPADTPLLPGMTCWLLYWGVGGEIPGTTDRILSIHGSAADAALYRRDAAIVYLLLTRGHDGIDPRRQWKQVRSLPVADAAAEYIRLLPERAVARLVDNAEHERERLIVDSFVINGPLLPADTTVTEQTLRSILLPNRDAEIPESD